MNDMNNMVNDPFSTMNRGNNEGEIKKLKKVIYVLISVIVFLIIFMLLKKVFSSPVKVVDPKPKENLDEVALTLEDFISDNHLDSLDVFGFNEFTRVAISSICDGVASCLEVEGEAVSNFVKKVFDKEIVLSDVNCEINDGILYKYDAGKNVFIYQNHNHDKYTKPLLTKVYSIKKSDNKYTLVLNKLYYDGVRSEFVSSDPMGVHHIYSFEDYDVPSSGGMVLDVDRVITSYEKDYSKLKEKGVKYEYTFIKKGRSYYLSKYKVLTE